MIYPHAINVLLFVFLLQTTRIEFDLPEYCVRRRYQDFDWLRIKLEDSQPTHLIPVGQTSRQANGRRVLRFPSFTHRFSLLVCSRCRRSSS